MQPKPRKPRSILLQELIKTWQTDDTLASYTGTPKDGEKPTQDADDL